MNKRITRKQRHELKELIRLRTRWDADTVRIDARGNVTARLDPDQITGLTAKQRRFRGLIGHYPQILFFSSIN